MRNYEYETEKRIEFYPQIFEKIKTNGIVFGSSGGKDSVLAGILARKATPNVLGVIMPCESKINFGQDRQDAELLAKTYDIKHVLVDLTNAKREMVKSLCISDSFGNSAISENLNRQSEINIAPRLRMTTLYAIASNYNYLVVGTSNRSETYMGYFTKWGDAACDFNPIFDLTVTEIYQFLKYLNVPEVFLTKPPSAGLYEGQTDESDMGITYTDLDRFLLGRDTSDKIPGIEKIKRAHSLTAHKRAPIQRYSSDNNISL